MQVHLVVVGRSQIARLEKEKSVTPELGRVPIVDPDELHDASLLEGADRSDLERRGLDDAADVADEQRASGNEDRLGVVGVKLDDQLAAQAVNFANPTDDHVT